jgi:hypothetical protein
MSNTKKRKYPRSMDADQITEKVNTMNVLAAIDHSKGTREIVNELVAQNKLLLNELISVRVEIANLTKQVGILRGQVYGGGPTAGG